MSQKHPPKRAALFRQIQKKPRAYRVYLALLVLTATVALCSALLGQNEGVFICFLAFLLYFIPPLVEKAVKVELPTALEILAFLFIFSAEILGELANFYGRVPLWDTLLHTVCGFMFTAFGFSLADIFGGGKRGSRKLSPAFLAFVAFCFAMTVGVFWEFVEFGIDFLLHKDMQKDFLIHRLYSISYAKGSAPDAIALNEIAHTVIQNSDGSEIRINGYLDIGLIDTMKDLLVNAIGAVIFSIIGFCYLKKEQGGGFAEQFIPQYQKPSDESHTKI